MGVLYLGVRGSSSREESRTEPFAARLQDDIGDVRIRVAVEEPGSVRAVLEASDVFPSVEGQVTLSLLDAGEDAEEAGVVGREVEFHGGIVPWG